MVAFLLRRLVYNTFVLVGVAFIVFALVFLASDPAAASLPITAPPDVVDAFRRAHGYDRPIPIQFVDFLGHALRGDFGTSTRFGQPALSVVLERVPATLVLALVGLAVSVLISFPLGLAAAWNRGRWPDHIARGIAVVAQAVPNVVLGPLFILVFAVTLKILPVSGSGGVQYLVLPGIVVGLGSAAGLTRILRSSLLEVLGRDYIRTAYAKGLSDRMVLLRHALKNAAIPVVTFLAFDVAAILSGVIIVEVIFAYPGMGRLAFQAITNRDLPVIQAFVFVAGLTIVTVNLLLDLVYVVLDPRIRVS